MVKRQREEVEGGAGTQDRLSALQVLEYLAKGRLQAEEAWVQELLKNCEAEVATTYAKTLRSKPEVDDQPSEAAGKALARPLNATMRSLIRDTLRAAPKGGLKEKVLVDCLYPLIAAPLAEKTAVKKDALSVLGRCEEFKCVKSGNTWTWQLDEDLWEPEGSDGKTYALNATD